MANMDNNANSFIPNSIKFYFSLTVLPIGVVLNTVSGKIFFTYSLGKHSTNMGLLYGVLSTLNVLALINLLLFNILDYNQYNYEYSEFTCKFMNIWTKVFLHFPSFQQVLIAFYLWLSICHSNKYKAALKKTWHFELGIFTYIMCLSVTNLTYFIGKDPESSYLSSSSNHSLICIAVNKLDFTSDCINIINRAILPCIIIFLLNAFSLKKILHMSKKFNNGKKSSNFMNAIIGMNLVFLVVYLPWGIVFFIHHTTNYVSNDPDSLNMASFVNSFSFQMIFSICDCISYFNNMTPFFFNIWFNAKFRKEIFYMFNIKQSLVSTKTGLKKPNNNKVDIFVLCSNLNAIIR